MSTKMKVATMTAQVTVFVLLLTFAFSSAFEICEEGLRTQVLNGTEGWDGSLQAEDGTVYPQNTTWQEDDFWWACPCLSGPCVRICPITPRYINDFYYIADYFQKNISSALIYDAGEFETEIWENDMSNKTALITQFKLVQLMNETEVCTMPGTEVEINVHTQLLKNGSLRHFPANVSSKIIHDPGQFCLFPVEWENYNLALVCVKKYETTIYQWLYPTFFVTSIFFLVLTLIAQYMVNKDFRSLHVKLLVNHCLSLIFANLVFTILFAIGRFAEGAVCYIIAYLTYYFNMVACFWLNVMCYEIYSTFKSGYGKHNLKIKYLVLYAWGSPLVLTLIAVLMQFTLSVDHFMHPKIGYMKCWFSDKLQEFIYYQGPSMVLFVANIVLFVMTTVVLRRLRRESSAALSTDDSKVHQAEDDKNSSKSRLAMYLKLFLLMGCTWIFEFVSWIFDDLQYIWIFTDAFNYLRGLFVFWITVIANPSVRKVVQEKLLKAVCCKR